MNAIKLISFVLVILCSLSVVIGGCGYTYAKCAACCVDKPHTGEDRCWDSVYVKRHCSCYGKGEAAVLTWHVKYRDGADFYIQC